MNPQLSLLLILLAFLAPFFCPGSASVLRPFPPPPPPPPSSALTTSRTTPTYPDHPPTTNALLQLLPRAPGNQAPAGSMRCNCRPVMQWIDCIFYQVLNWPKGQNVITRLHDELIKCGDAKRFGLQKYYVPPERESGGRLGAFALFRLPGEKWNPCWLKAISIALRPKGVKCDILLPPMDDAFPWWEEISRTRPSVSGLQFSKPPPDYVFPPDN